MVEPAVELLVEKEVGSLRSELGEARRELREYAGEQARVARREAIGVLGTVALVLTIIGGLGLKPLVERIVEAEIEKLVGNEILEDMGTRKKEAQQSAEESKAILADLQQRFSKQFPNQGRMSFGTFHDLGVVLEDWCGHEGAVSSLADANGDGRTDLICSDSTGGHWVALAGEGGTFTNIGKLKDRFCGHEGSKASWADVDGDGAADLTCSDTQGKHWVLLSEWD